MCSAKMRRTSNAQISMDSLPEDFVSLRGGTGLSNEKCSFAAGGTAKLEMGPKRRSQSYGMLRSGQVFAGTRSQVELSAQLRFTLG